ncbi:MAG: EscU/YscU/HrcU family type III secretion system export apparatus switch protein [Gammaproteobacteria bacterium]|nr:EscU/YscU/HrcU family type III secretion system export apparatus switch protein [Gammaproteobacteria bacterium]MDH3767982.1 EscU/YscU/HrcU family type III secretion system export apparatus switch protein [Gammaproteobacteria bacterium]
MSDIKEQKPAVAVALNYPGKGAPKVMAKGHGLVAENILRLARESDIPLWQDAGLAGVLAQIDLGDEIPEALYTAVAEVIAFAWQLRNVNNL